MASKKSKTKNIRHILESPFQIKWSEKSADEIAPIQRALMKHLPAAKLEKVVINLQMKGKKDSKESTIKNLEPKQQNALRTYLAPGFQSVVRGLEKGELCCVLVSSDIAPIMLLNVIIVQAQVAGVPILVIPNLKTLTKSTLGFSTMALGFKNAVASSPEIIFHEIFLMVSQNPTIISAPAYPIKVKEERLCTEPMEEFSEEVEKPPVKLSQPIKPKNLYLYRSPNGNRAFIPEINKKDCSLKSDIKTEIGENFILLEKNPEPVRKAVKIKENVMRRMSDDDDDSNDEVCFFEDTKADETLIERLELKIESENNTKKSGSFKAKKGPLSKNKLSKKHKKKTKKNKIDNSSKINFKPLQIKTITANPNRLKGKNKSKIK